MEPEPAKENPLYGCHIQLMIETKRRETLKGLHKNVGQGRVCSRLMRWAGSLSVEAAWLDALDSEDMKFYRSKSQRARERERERPIEKEREGCRKRALFKKDCCFKQGFLTVFELFLK